MTESSTCSGKRVWVWYDTSVPEIIAPLTSNKLLILINGNLGVLEKNNAFYPSDEISGLEYGVDFRMAPNGKVALANFGKTTMFLSYIAE